MERQHSGNNTEVVSRTVPFPDSFMRPENASRTKPRRASGPNNIGILDMKWTYLGCNPCSARFVGSILYIRLFQGDTTQRIVDGFVISISSHRKYKVSTTTIAIEVNKKPQNPPMSVRHKCLILFPLLFLSCRLLNAKLTN